MISKIWFETITWNLITALCVRMLLLIYGSWQDEVMAVGFTDIDYTVFTDAARYMTEGLSPYRRATYRYTPILAFVLQGNISLFAGFGKVLFILCDILVGYLIYKSIQKTEINNQKAIRSAQLWLFNPLTMVVSTRGNAESVMAVLVLGMLFQLKAGGPRNLIFSAVLYGLSVHTKIYPAIYALAIYLYINAKTVRKIPTNLPLGANLIRYLIPTIDSLLFGLTGFITFVAVTGACYAWFGDEFMTNTYLYHITRRDIRHNFSVYFYFLYLTSSSETSAFLAILAFLPQLLVILFITAKFHRDIEFTSFLLTFVFVTFNKVCTSQYFLWYLCLLPLVITTVKNDHSQEYIVLFLLWLLGQGLWLFPAYLLEFHGYNVYIYIWLAGLAFFIINVYVVYKMIVLYQPVRHVSINSK